MAKATHQASSTTAKNEKPEKKQDTKKVETGNKMPDAPIIIPTEDLLVKPAITEVRSPLEIINMANLPKIGSVKTDEEIDDDINPIDDGSKGSSKPSIEEKDENSYLAIDPEIPKEFRVNKIAIKKISRFSNRLGLEKSPEKFNIMPGVAHTWSPSKKGDQFLTGLNDKPETRERLEKLLHIALDNKSPFYATLTFKMEDKEHGQILNFDDKQMGPFYEVVYYAMLESDIIANGLHEYSSGAKPFAEWYIENKEAEAEAKQAGMTVEMEARKAFEDASLSKRAGISRLLGLPTWGLKDNLASVELWDYLKLNTENAKAFLNIIKLNDTQFQIAVLVRNAIQYNVIRKDKLENLTFANQILGRTQEHVVNLLMLVSNADLRRSIQSQVDSKLK